jgi:hypothetical protein
MIIEKAFEIYMGIGAIVAIFLIILFMRSPVTYNKLLGLHPCSNTCIYELLVVALTSAVFWPITISMLIYNNKL